MSRRRSASRLPRAASRRPDRDAILARIVATPDYGAIAGADLVIEAVFEDRKVKEEAVKKAEAVLGDKVIFGSNTSTLPITSLAELSKRPDRFIGVHFFSPVEKMMLVELIMGKKTGDEALAVALDYVRAIKKTPIVVNNSRGFYTSRVVGTYIREGHLMLTEGVPAPMVENVGRMAGMPVGPLSLNDEVAVDLAWKILQATKKDLGSELIDPRQEALLEEMVVKRGRNGRKNGKGFYDYPETGPKRLWPGLAELAGAPRPAETFDVETLKQRFLGIQALESARCVEEGVITDVRDARRRLDSRLRLCSVHRRHALLYRRHGGGEFRGAVRAAGGPLRTALRTVAAAARDGEKGRDLLWPLRAGRGQARRLSGCIWAPVWVRIDALG